MKTRILIAALALVFGFTNLASAEEFTHKGHKLKASFPMTSKHVEKKIDSDDGEATVDMFVCGGDGKAYMLMVVEMEGKKLSQSELTEYMKSFIPGLDDNFKNVKIVKESELELNKSSPKGRCYLLQHDDGMMVLWATVQNGKIYIAWLMAPTKKDLGSDEAKEFLMSIQISKK